LKRQRSDVSPRIIVIPSNGRPGRRPTLEACVLRKTPVTARVNWARRLPRPIIIPKVVAITTLADARGLVEQHLPAEYRAKHTWQQISKLLVSAARGDGDPADVEIALRLVLAMEGIQCRPR
jgi:hypothetical protein